MAKKCLKIKRPAAEILRAKYNRCPLSGRARASIAVSKMCRLCLRKYALRGQLPGVVKASW